MKYEIKFKSGMSSEVNKTWNHERMIYLLGTTMEISKEQYELLLTDDHINIDRNEVNKDNVSSSHWTIYPRDLEWFKPVFVDGKIYVAKIKKDCNSHFIANIENYSGKTYQFRYVEGLSGIIPTFKMVVDDIWKWSLDQFETIEEYDKGYSRDSLANSYLDNPYMSSPCMSRGHFGAPMLDNYITEKNNPEGVTPQFLIQFESLPFQHVDILDELTGLWGSRRSKPKEEPKKIKFHPKTNLRIRSL